MKNLIDEEQQQLQQQKNLQLLVDPQASAIGKFRELIENSLQPGSGNELTHFGATSLLELISLEPQFFGVAYAPFADRLKPLLSGSRAETREIIAKIIGLLSSELVESKRLSLIDEFLSQAARSNTNHDQIHGSTLALGYIAARCTKMGISVPKLQQIGLQVYLLLGHSNNTVSGVASLAMGEIGRYAPLPFADGDQATAEKLKIDDHHNATLAQQLTKWHIVLRLFASLTCSERKVTGENLQFRFFFSLLTLPEGC